MDRDPIAHSYEKTPCIHVKFEVHFCDWFLALPILGRIPPSFRNYLLHIYVSNGIQCFTVTNSAVVLSAS